MSVAANQTVHSIAHPSDIAGVRRCAGHVGAQAGLDEQALGRLALVVTESATNILKHAGNGKIILAPVRDDAICALEVVALDCGPGIANLAACLRDGMSTAGTAGTGLGAMRRNSDLFDAYTGAGKGAAFYMCLSNETEPGAQSPVKYGAVCEPMRGEEACGDDWVICTTGSQVATMLVADGLGHGPEAAKASQAAVRTVQAHPDMAPLLLIDEIHRALAPTRGAAAAVAQIDFHAGLLNFVGVGNISASVVTHESSKKLVSHNGIVGHNMRKAQQFTLPWQPGCVCIMHSDGMTANWDLQPYPGLLACHPSLIAGVLYRDFGRDRDDTTIVVLK